MALLQISEPGLSPASHQRRLAVGIDFGTTNSLVSAVRSGKAQTLPDLDGCHLLPSVVHYGHNKDENSLITVGYHAQKHAASDPCNTVSSIKRLIGKPAADIDASALPYSFSSTENGMPVLNLPNKSVNPIQVAANILNTLAIRAKETLEGDLDGVVITVPAYFDDSQRQAIKDAASLAGLQVLRLLNEPTAAAIAYGLDSGQEGIIAIYDLGGGTFDISILRLSKGVFEVLATGGDVELGGDDFDHLIANHIKQELGLTQCTDPHLNQSILEHAEQAKIALSSKSEIVIQIGEHQLPFTSEQFNRLIEPLIKKTLFTCRRTLKDADVALDDLVSVVMVGGSTRVPFVRKQVEQFFKQPPLTSIDPDKVVAIGAGIQADILVGNKPDSDMLLLDVTPLSLGIETMGGLVEKIIPRNSTIPCARAQEFTTFKDGQTAMTIHVLQGERDTVTGCRSLAQFVLKDIPPMVAGAAHIRVTFQVDADGLLNVTAMEKSTNIQATIQVKPSYGLTDNEIANMIRDSLSHAQSDKLTRKLSELKVDAARVLETLRSVLEKDADLLSPNELSEITKAQSQLENAANGQNSDDIEKQIKILDRVTQHFASLRMDKSIRQALSGQHIDDIN